jgi:transposase-like protein
MAGLVGITLLQLYTILQLGTMEVARFCMTFGLLPKRYKCPICHNYAKLCGNRGRAKKQTTWRCRLAACGGEISVRLGTVFGRSKLPMETVLKLLYFWSSRRSIEDTAMELETSRKTVTDWFKFCRELCAKKMEVSTKNF